MLQELLPREAKNLLRKQQIKFQQDWHHAKKVLPDLEEQEYLYSWFLVGTRSFYYEIEETLSYPSHDRLALLPPGDRIWVATRGLASGGGVPEWDDWMHGKEDADGALAKARAMLPGFLARGDVEDYRRRITELRDDANAANMDVLLQRWNQLDELARANGRAKQQSRGKNMNKIR